MTLWPGQKVRLIDIKTPGLNGLQGKVLAFDKLACRWRVDLGESHGVKALKEENLSPLGGSESSKQESAKPIRQECLKFEAGDLISSLLGNNDDLNSEDSDDRASEKQEETEEPWKPGDADHKRMEEEVNPWEPIDVGEEPNLRTPSEQVDAGADDKTTDDEGTPDEKVDGGFFTVDAGADQKRTDDEGTPDEKVDGGSFTEASGRLDEQDELSKLTVKELKLRLTALNVSILGVTEKRELIALVRKHPSASSVSSQDGSRPKAGVSGATNADPDVSTKYAHPGKPWETSGPPAQPANAPTVPSYGHERPPFAYGAPPYGAGYPTPPPGWGHPAWSSYQRPPQFYAPVFMPHRPLGFPGQFGYGPPPCHFPLMPRDKAIDRAQERMAQQPHNRNILDGINNFVRDLKLSYDFEMGLRILNPQVLQYIMSLKFPTGSHELVLSEMRRADPEAEAIVRSLLQNEVSPSSSPSDTARGRRRRKHKRKKSSIDKNNKKSRARNAPHSTQSLHVGANTKGTEEAPGVWGSPERDVGNADSSGRGVGNTVGVEDTGDIREWLMQLDQGRGALECYLQPLCAEFQNLDAIKETVLAKPLNGSIIGKIDPSLWKALGEPKLGHKMLLSKGIVALAT